MKMRLGVSFFAALSLVCVCATDSTEAMAINHNSASFLSQANRHGAHAHMSAELTQSGSQTLTHTNGDTKSADPPLLGSNNARGWSAGQKGATRYGRSSGLSIGNSRMGAAN
eukprot:GDKI01014890.1.p2 GENE.GDKI01014890.1~~GDKI01014890.1.p2  ORF type:complete len:112 (-),score=27.67 GDKI01014890.1:161-496(-)